MIEKESIMHYASKYYDPVKAHEYYMRTRELKGRRSSAKLNDEGKKIWSSVKNEIKTEKKGEVTEAQSERDEKIEQLRETAKQTRERISARLKEVREALTASSKEKRQDVSESVETQIDAVRAMNIPSAKKKAMIAEIRSDGRDQRAQISEETKSTREGYSNDASAQRAEVASQLKTAISAARDAYKQAKSSLDQSYETTYQAEYNKILASYAKKSKGKSKKDYGVSTAKSPIG